MTKPKTTKTLLDFIRGMDKAHLEAFARKAETSAGNVQQIAYGHGYCSSVMARKLAEASGWEVSPHSIAPDHYPYPLDGLPPAQRTA